MFGSSEQSSARGGYTDLNSLFGSGSEINFLGNTSSPLFIFGGIFAIALLLLWRRR